MLPDRVSNPGPLTYESGVLPFVLSGPAGRSVNLTTLFRGRLRPPNRLINQYFVHILSPVTDNCPS